MPDFPFQTESHLYDMHMTPCMVSAVLFKLGPHKVCSLNDIPAAVLKKCAHEIAPLLFKLYNNCPPHTCFQVCWKSSSLIKNSGKLFDPLNYQAINFLPPFNNLLKVLISSKSHLTMSSVRQYGFCFSRLTGNVLMIIAERVCQRLDMNGEA